MIKVANTYFAADGNYGDAHGIVFVDTNNWDAHEFELIDRASDWERPELAQLLDVWVKSGRNNAELEARLAQYGFERVD